jgi:hypothetical protein
MDPNATLRRIISHFFAEEREECREHCDNLTAWLKARGFSPARFDPRDVLGFCRVVERVANTQLERARESRIE